MSAGSCCTCAAILSSSPVYSCDYEKPTLEAPPRRLTCCNRSICAKCISRNPRFADYCPFCQISSKPSSLPQGLRDPPAYSYLEASGRSLDQPAASFTRGEPPPYASIFNSASNPAREPDSEGPDVTHYLRSTDTPASLSLAYKVPIHILRRRNNLYSDHLISAHNLIYIPGSHYKGPSLSPNPPDGEEETERKSKLRRFMVNTKCHKYEEAELYLKQADYDLSSAIQAWKEDEIWERENPVTSRAKGKQPSRRAQQGAAGGLVSQAM